MGIHYLRPHGGSRVEQLRKSFYFGYVDLHPDELSPEQIAKMLYQDRWGTTIKVKRCGNFYIVYEDETELTQIAAFDLDAEKMKFRIKYDYEFEVSGS